MLTRYKEFFDKLFEPPARLCAKAGISPNVLTVSGLGLGYLACLILLQTRNLLLFSGVIVLFGLLDALDGRVARLTGKTSRFGSYLDAMCDRYYESAVILSVAYVTGYWVPSGILLAGCLITSYAKARAGMEVVILNTEWPDILERTERSIIYMTGLVVSEIFKIQVGGHDIFYWTLILLASGTHVTVIQRMARAQRIIEERGADQVD